MIKHGVAPYMECSSKGDKRYSAFYARIRGRENRSIEDIYQGAKVFADGAVGLSWREAKGRAASNMPEVLRLYSALWDEYINENPSLGTILVNASGVSDVFGQKGHVCQATELWRIRETLVILNRRDVDWFVDAPVVPNLFSSSPDAEFVFDDDAECGWSSLEWRECEVPVAAFGLKADTLDDHLDFLPHKASLVDEQLRAKSIEMWMRDHGCASVALHQSPLLITLREGKVKIEDGYHRLGVAVFCFGQSTVKALCAIYKSPPKPEKLPQLSDVRSMRVGGNCYHLNGKQTESSGIVSVVDDILEKGDGMSNEVPQIGDGRGLDELQGFGYEFVRRDEDIQRIANEHLGGMKDITGMVVLASDGDLAEVWITQSGRPFDAESPYTLASRSGECRTKMKAKPKSQGMSV